MGNRGVITTEYNFEHNGVGVYLHWNGGYDSVSAFLEYCKLKGYRTPDQDCYGWARLVQVIGNFFGGSTSLGIDTVDRLDCDNWDNGVYIIKGWDIVDRKFHEGLEQNEYDMQDMLKYIDERQPKEEQLGTEFFDAPEVETELLLKGDEIFFMNYTGWERATVVGLGENGKKVNGHDVTNVPYVGKFGSEQCPIENNINNYLLGTKYRVIGISEADAQRRREYRTVVEEIRKEEFEQITMA